MSRLPKRFWAEMTWRDFAAADMTNMVAVLPIAAIEQHGPHLPVGVDTFIMEGYLNATVERLPADINVLFLPVQAIGKSNEHIAYPGTLTLSAETVIRAWTEIGESVARTGCRKLVIVNSHGGNVSAMDIVARELRVRCNMLAVTCSWHRFGYPEGMLSAHEAMHGIHAGDAETSLMLAFRPDTVKMAEARNFEPASAEIARQNTYLRATQPIGFGWMSQDLSAAGAMGDASAATLTKGEAAAAHGAAAFVTLLREVAAFDITRLRAGPLDGADQKSRRD
jgi:creatinine amidohydrolase